MVSTRAATATVSAPSMLGQKRRAPAPRRASKRVKLDSDAECSDYSVSDHDNDTSDEDATSADEQSNKENTRVPTTPRVRRAAQRATDSVDSPSAGKRARKHATSKARTADDLNSTPTKAARKLIESAPSKATTPSKRPVRLSLGNATNRPDDEDDMTSAVATANTEKNPTDTKSLTSRQSRTTRRVVHSEDETMSSDSESSDDEDSAPAKTPTRGRTSTRKCTTSSRPSKTISPSKRGTSTRVIASPPASSSESGTEFNDAATPDTSLEIDGEFFTTAAKTPFGQARGLLRAPLAPDAELVGRDSERRELLAYLRSRTAKSLYVSGTPGTGKTALVREVLAAFEKGKQSASTDGDEELEEWYRELPARKVYVNCVGKGEDAVWDAILEAVDAVDASNVRKRSRSTSPSKLARSPTKKVRREGRKEFERWLSTEGGRCILVLDEVDHLSPSSGVLAGVFAMPAQINSSTDIDPDEELSTLRVVAISNSHTLGSRSAHVTTLHFAPYNREQMVEIVKDKFKPIISVPASPTAAVKAPLVVPPAVITFAAAKVAAVTGDLRSLVALLVKTFDVAERRCAKAGKDTPMTSGPPDVLEALKSVQLVAAAKVSRAATTVSRPVLPTSASAPSTFTGSRPAPTPVVPKMRAGPTAGLALQPKLALLCLMLAKRRLASGLGLGILGTNTTTDPFSTFGSSQKSPSKSKSPAKPKSPSKSAAAQMVLDAHALHAFYTVVVGRSSHLQGVSRIEFADVLAVLEACGAATQVASSSSSSAGLTRTPSFARTMSFGRSASFGSMGLSAGARALEVPDSVRPEDLWIDAGVEGELVHAVWDKELRVIERDMPRPQQDKALLDGMEVDD
ncbi:hypothetical protein BKA62DRAFT_642997 [Auriculariales sp. MPI-PUGE-AT-0066]|nr:hypothetical protein BKA62DRAFT_642997 [Auriculariales sp. MPI-PUGE-AT-0066]